MKDKLKKLYNERAQMALDGPSKLVDFRLDHKYFPARVPNPAERALMKAVHETGEVGFNEYEYIVLAYKEMTPADQKALLESLAITPEKWAELNERWEMIKRNEDDGSMLTSGLISSQFADAFYDAAKKLEGQGLLNVEEPREIDIKAFDEIMSRYESTAQERGAQIEPVVKKYLEQRGPSRLN